MSRNLLRSIKKSLGRYIAIAMIIALGAGLFVGLRMTKADMVATGQKYTDEQNMFDLRLVCSYGWSQEQVDAVRNMDGLVDVEGVFYTDLIVNVDQSDEDRVYRIYTIPEKINRLVLLGGRMPQNGDECLIDGFHNGKKMLGKKIVIQENNEETSLENLNYRTLTVVGYVRSPLYMDMNRGTTSVGNGSIADCLYVPPETFNVSYFTEIQLTIPGDYKIYSDSYNDAMDTMADRMEADVKILAAQRLEQVIAEAEEKYQDGLQAYQDGAKEYTEGMHEAYDELKEAYFDLLDGEQAIIDGEKELEDNEKKIKNGWVDLRAGRAKLDSAEKELEDNEYIAKKNLADAKKELDTNSVQVESGLEMVNVSVAAVQSMLEVPYRMIESLENEISDCQRELEGYQASKAEKEAALHDKQAERDQLPEGEDTTVIDLEIAALQWEISGLDVLISERDATIQEKNRQIQEIKNSAAVKTAEEQLRELQAQQATLTESMALIKAGYAQLEAEESQLYAQLKSARQEIKAGRERLDISEKNLNNAEWEIKKGWKDLEKAKADLAEGWVEYEDGLAEARHELADGRKELNEAREELADAREAIDDMTENTIHILDRNTNIGYASLDSSSDIVEGVSRVFPAFFLLVAALVCITTMTRMVDEERTQIGTLKALGYSSASIISKYMLYAGSSAILGCGFGVLMGSVVFPAILWEAYKIMLFVDDTIVLTFDYRLCLAVVGAYAGVELLVTWYCCRRALEEVPAELIRPKAPTSGKQLIFEKLPVWNKVSFLNKVTIRNIFRYRQRLAMMLVGIGGCTALLLTGFGLRDSIVNIVDFQFEDVTTYDMEVYFAKGQTQQQMQEFREEMKPFAENTFFYYQTSVEIQAEEQAREIYMIAAEEGIRDFIDFHSGEAALPFPGVDEMLLSSGVAEALGVKAGDTVLLRNSDMQTLDLTISGVYENYVYNYAILSPGTIEKQWGFTPEAQMAMVSVLDGQDVHQVGSEIAAFSNVMNVSVSDDLAFMVHNMMDALDLVIWVIVFCAALLAATVLYNLTNININERIREIATIKVLGFNASETGMYIFKENLILSVFGAGCGLLFGKLLLAFVMSQIKINMVWFVARALPLSYVLSVIITILMALIVDFVFYFKLQKINMAEALKSVE